MKLMDLHESFIELAHRPMNFASNPVIARRAVPIIVPVDKWEKSDVGLVKRFEFRRSEDRIRFVSELMEYEEAVQHHAEMTLKEGEVTLKLITKNVSEVTESDREFARFADSVFKDIVYSP